MITHYLNVGQNKKKPNYDWRLFNLQLHGFCCNDGKLIRGVRETAVV
jgi:hypothetical protein